MSLSKVLEVARADLGYTESPANSNMTKYGEWYGMNGQPWCVMALAFWFDQAGERMAFMGGGQTASCSILLRWYKEQGLTVPVEDVQAGDIVILNFHGTKDTEHCGLVVDTSIRLDPKTGAPEFVVTVEGNTSPGLEGSQANGGCVALKNRDRWRIVAVCRPQYQPEEPQPEEPQPEEPQPEDDITGHWAEDDIRWCVAHGLMKGYPDGSFQPDRAVTRAELAVILDRLDKEDDLK